MVVAPTVLPPRATPQERIGRFAAVQRSLASTTVKLPALVPVAPVGVVTAMGPVEARSGTVAVMLVAELTV